MKNRAVLLVVVSLAMALVAGSAHASSSVVAAATPVATQGVVLSVAPPPAPVAVAKTIRPSQSQLRRLYHLEPYIRYFTSLAYGPDNARVSADYIRALILTESAGDKWAHSNKGARGLTQIIPSTAKLIARELGADDYDYLYVDERVFDDFTAEHLYDPAINILMACYLSATYHKQFDGRTELVVSAWNAGPGAVSRYNNEPPPYPETQKMIGRVRGYISYLEQAAIH